MKKTITLLAILIATTLFAQNTYVPDDNFEQALIDLGYDSGALDDYVPTANINTIAILNLDNQNIADLTGIQDFIALEELYLRNDLLTSIDVSNNSALRILNIYNNTITEINTSNNIALEWLITTQNPLTALDLHLNINLTKVYCINNSLTSFNVKNGNNTAITNLNLSLLGNNSLTCVLVDDAAWSTANWTYIPASVVFNDVSCSPQTFVPDDNFEQALIDLGYDSGALDDYVPTANISGLTSLNVGNKNISDLTGIEDFTALTSLTFSYNNIQSVDISNNTALTELYCLSNQLLSLDISNNTLLTTVKCHYNQLTALDVSANTALEILWCQQNTSLSNLNVSGAYALTHLSCSDTALTNLDISNNTNLIELKCGNSQIASLDVSNNTVLTLLWCQNSQLTSLNVKNGNNTNVVNADFDATNNLNLTCIEVDDATWSTTNWTSIDATANFSEHCVGGVPMTYVPDDNFEQALIDLGYDSGTLDDYVPTANISGVTNLYIENKSIGDLTGIEDFTALTSLSCRSNQLLSLDITQNTALTTLYCNSNNLTSLDVSQNTALTTLNCFNNFLTSLDVTQNTALTQLWCYSNPLSSLDVTQNVALVRLDCSSNDLTSLDVSNNTALIHFSCSNNNLTNLDLGNNTSIASLYCHSNQLTNLDLTQNPALSYFKCNNNALTSLNIKNGNNTNIPLSNFRAINNPNLTCIEVDNAAWSTANWTNIDATANFSEHCVGGVPMTYVPDDNFEQALIDLGYDSGTLDDYVPTANISGVTLLDVNSKNIADLTGIQDFVALTELYCLSNQLTDLDLTQNTHLEKLNCASNSLTSVSFNANVSLTHLNIANNQFTSLDVSNYTLLLLLSTSNNLLTSLNVSNNTNLSFLRCNGNQLTELNVKNGNNTNVVNANFNAANNPNLTCILVDDAAYSTTNWTNIDATSTFVNNQAECDALSVAENSFETQINLYPNPAKNSFSIMNKNNFTIEQIRIYNLLGKLVYNTTENRTSISTSSLVNGVYFVKLKNGNQFITKKIIINK